MGRDKFYKSITMILNSFDGIKDKKITELRGQFAGGFINVDIKIIKYGSNGVDERDSELEGKTFKIVEEKNSGNWWMTSISRSGVF